MEALRELKTVSNYRPTNGDLLYLFQLLEEQVNRNEAVLLFKGQEKDRSAFRGIYKRLKDNLLNGILANSFHEYTAVQRAHFSTYKKFTQSKVLIQSEKRVAGMNVAAETVATAEKYGMVEIAFSLSRDLQTHYATVSTDRRKYKFYSEKVFQMGEELKKETEVQYWFSELAYRIKKKQDCSEIPAVIDRISQLKPSKFYRFNMIRYNLLNLWYRHTNDLDNIVRTCREAMQFFESSDTLLPYTTKWNFGFHMVPVLIGKGNYAQADSVINHILELPALGSYNWNITLIYKALLGFHSDKPMIALEAWRQSDKTTWKFESPEIQQRWHLIRAYLEIYAKLGRITVPGRFKLYKFLNSIPAIECNKYTTNVSVIIATLMNLALDGKRKEFMKKTDTLNNYIKMHLTDKKAYARSKYFLKMMEKVEQADFYRLRTEARVKAWRSKLEQMPALVSVNILEHEVIPLERAWGMMLRVLK